MKRYKSSDFKYAFSQLPLNKNDTLLIHNSFLTFGIPSGIPINQISGIIYSNLTQIIGNKGTIVVPTFNFDFCKGVPFNRQKTPSQNMGVFSEYIRTHPASRRSFHPMQSVAAIGYNANMITQHDTQSAFSTLSPFDIIKKLNAKIILLGANFNAISLIHLLEEKHNVPYRYWKEFTGKYIDNNISSIKTYKMFVRSLELNPILNLNSIEKELKKVNKLHETTVGSGLIKLFYANDFITIVENNLKKNPYFYISNHPNFEQL